MMEDVIPLTQHNTRVEATFPILLGGCGKNLELSMLLQSFSYRRLPFNSRMLLNLLLIIGLDHKCAVLADFCHGPEI